MARQLRADSVYRHFFDNDGLSMWAAVMLGPLSRTAPPSMMRCPPISAVSRSNQRVGSARPPGARRDSATFPFRKRPTIARHLTLDGDFRPIPRQQLV